MNENHRQYVKYYETRMNKYKGNENYPNSYESEKALYEAVSSSAEMIDFKHKLEGGNLAVKNAIALIKDKETLNNKHYNKLKEFVRAGSSKEILEKIESSGLTTDIDVANFVSDILQKYSLLISIDEMSINAFKSDINHLENIEVWEKAEIVDEFKEKVKGKWIQDSVEQGRKRWRDVVLPSNRQWAPDWNIDYNLIFGEERHRRKLPYPDDVVKKQIEQHKNYGGTE